MNSPPRPSFVVGNSWQLHRLSHHERDALDREPYVFVCNLFPQHWRRIGFRPTGWIMGDTYNPQGCEVLANQLETVRTDDELASRLKHLFVCIESPPAAKIIAASDLPVTEYRRGDWKRRGQTLSPSLDEPFFHFGSTLTNALNLSRILNPGGEVRLLGCQYGNQGGHFYETEEGVEDNSTLFTEVVTRMWQGFSDLARDGIELFDCNWEHSSKMPDDFRLPRKPLFP